MAGEKDLRERTEFTLAFITSALAGLLAFLFVWLLGVIWEW